MPLRPDITKTSETTSCDGRHLQSANELIAARRQRRISRRGLIARALELGLSAPVVGVLLHATGDLAYGAPRAQTGDETRRSVAATKRTSPKGTERRDATARTAWG